MNWIPVSEKLPTQPVRVLVSAKDSDGVDFVMAAVWTELVDMETGEIIGPATFTDIEVVEGNLLMTDIAKDNNVRITAWMPYPEPYKENFRVIIAGSRTFQDYKFLCEKLDKIFAKHRPTAIVCGEARGADTLGRRYAEEHYISVESYPADWVNLGKKAGYIRNEQMADNAEALVAFWVNDSAGTKHMIESAEARGLQVRVFKI